MFIVSVLKKSVSLPETKTMSIAQFSDSDICARLLPLFTFGQMMDGVTVDCVDWRIVVKYVEDIHNK